MIQKIKFINKDKTQFYKILKERVDAYFEENKISSHANATMVFKSVVMLCLFFVPYALIMTQGYSLLGMWVCTLVMGTGLAGIGMSIQHDANHDAYSASPFINKLMSLTLSLAGGDNQNWKTQHNVLHHTYTNIHGYDRDIDDKVGMRFSPAGKHHKAQRFQVVYVFFFYAIMSLYWATGKDFVQFFQFIKEGYDKDSLGVRIGRFLYIIFWKVVYYTYLIVLPLMYLEVTGLQVFIGFLSFHAVAGLILSITFQLAHVVEGSAFPVPDAKGNIESEWAIHQLQTTVDFAKDNRFLTFYLGGLNFQAIHHLFPRICHVHYPKLAPIVEKTAKEFGVPYMANDSFMSAFKSHMTVISKLAKNDISFFKFAKEMG